MSIFAIGILIYMIGFCVQQVEPKYGNGIRLIGAVVTIVGWLISRGTL
jgi:uncharacterized membrane protein